MYKENDVKNYTLYNGVLLAHTSQTYELVKAGKHREAQELIRQCREAAVRRGEIVETKHGEKK